MPLTLMDRFHPGRTRQQQAAIDAGKLQLLEEVELLSPAQLQPLACFSLILLILGALFFIPLNIVAYFFQPHPPLALSAWGITCWLIFNILAYILILPLHELIHGLAFAFWGGKPYFGAKWPFALFCGAKNQLFRRKQYLVIGLAPLVLITLAGIVFTLLSPTLASYILFGTIGNISGASGDLWTASKLFRLPSTALIEDSDLGYRAWQLAD